MNQLNLDRDLIDECREMADGIVYPINAYVNRHSSVSVERAILRLLGFDGFYDVQGVPYPQANLIMEKIPRKDWGLGAAMIIAGIKQRNPRWSQDRMAEKIIKGEASFERSENLTPETAHEILKPWVSEANTQFDRMRSKNGEHRARFKGDRSFTKLSVAIGSGNIDEDMKQVNLVGTLGADMIEMVRSSGQSLLDYLPTGATTTGFAGTFLTQGNLRLMRETIARSSEKSRHTCGLTVNALGLCAPEIAVMGMWERAHTLVADPLYAVLLRDINMKRAFIDQMFALQVMSRAGMSAVSATSDFVFKNDLPDNLQDVMVSLFINESLSKHAGLWDEQVGLSLSCVLNPAQEDGITHELTKAMLVSEVFPRCSVKYVFYPSEQAQDAWSLPFAQALYGLIGLMAGKKVIQICGTGAQPGFSAKNMDQLKVMRWLRQGGISLPSEIAYQSNGQIMRQSRQVLERTHKVLKRASDKSLFDALEDGQILDIKRAKDNGRGYDGIFEKTRNYFNPFFEMSSSQSSRR